MNDTPSQRMPAGTKKKFVTIAIDGGAATGKSSTAAELSRQFHLMHVDTGSFYRAITLKLLEADVSPGQADVLERALANFALGTRIEGNRATITINDWVPDHSIRSQLVNQTVSQFAAIPAVRASLLQYQRDLRKVAAENGFAGLVVEGRDIGSVVFPDAELRLFLKADPAKRAERRAKEGIVDSIDVRDRTDASRTVAPLLCPQGAVSLDTSSLTLPQVVERVSKMVEEL